MKTPNNFHNLTLKQRIQLKEKREQQDKETSLKYLFVSTLIIVSSIILCNVLGIQ